MPGLTTKIKERLEHAKEGAKERINPLSDTNKQKRVENRERHEELRKAERESYEEEEVKQAAERGKRSAQNRYSSRPHSRTERIGRNASNFARGTARASERQIFSGFTIAKGYNDLTFGGFAGPTKPKPKPPQRITTISKSGTVKVVETIEKPKPKEQPQDGFWDFGVAPLEPKKKGFQKKTKRIGDLI
jgi:hypothetical protein